MASSAAVLNGASDADAKRWLENCCAAERWVEAMLAARPFEDDERLQQQATEVWWPLDDADWRTAFAAHPKIGDMPSLRTKYAATGAWAAREQSGVAQAADETLRQLAAANAEYEARFGYIFIVFATGKSAAEMLAMLEQRLGNDPGDEIRIAAAEQLKITQLRLRKLATEAYDA